MRTVITDADVEAEARVMMRATIERSGWYPYMRPKDREKRIAQDVDQHWHLIASAAREKLTKRAEGPGEAG